MNTNFTFTAGGNIVQNPEWSESNPTVPKYINIADNHSNNSASNPLAESMYRATAMGNQEVLGGKELERYVNYGITPSNYTNLDAELADAQSNWVKAGNALAQTVVSEVGLGTVRAGFDIFDFVASKIFHVAEDDYQNPVSNTIAGWQEEFRNNIAPVYTTPGVDIQNGGLKDWSWWFSNVPTIASSLTLLIPAKGITGGISALGKLGKAGTFGKVGQFLSNGGHSVTAARKWFSGVKDIEESTKLSKFATFVNNPVNIAKANYAARTVAEATLMRTMENYQEAKDVYVPTYQEAFDKLSNMSAEQYQDWLTANKDIKQQLIDNDIDANDKDAVAKYIAKKAADRTFAMDWTNVVWDVIQLHSLSNIGKGVKEVTNRAARTAQREALEAAEGFAKGTAKEVSKTPWYKTLSHNTWELAKDGGKLAITEGNEAIEEAVNYIASQEGLTYGKALLEGKEDKYGKSNVPGVIDSWRFLQGSLDDYIKSSALQESAFWGFFGGVTFGGAGGAFNKAELALKRKAADKARQENPITGEKVESSNWTQLMEAPDTKAAREAINRRIVRLNQVKEDLKQIENNFDVLGVRDENGRVQQFTGSDDIIALKKEMARQQVINRFVSDITMDAMNSGTYNLLVDYFEDKRVQEALVTAGVTSQEQMQAQAEAISNQIKQTKEAYARESAHVLNQITALNVDKTNSVAIPLEYAQLIAKQNMDRRLDVLAIDKQIAALENIAVDQANNTEDADKVLFNGAKEAVSLGLLIDYYGRLSADEKAAKDTEARTAKERIEKDRTIRDIKAQKEAIAREISKTQLNGLSLGSSALFNAFKMASTYKKTGPTSYDSDESIAATDAQILKDVRYFFEDVLHTEETASDDTIIQMANKLYKDFEAITKEEGLANANAALFNTYATLTQLNTSKALILSQIKSSKSQINDYIDYLHNSFNEGRKALIIKAEETIRNAYIQYRNANNALEHDDIIRAVISAFENDKRTARELAEKAMATVPNREGIITAEELLDALDIMNFGATSNKALFEYIMSVLTEIDDRLTQQEAAQVVTGSRQGNESESDENSEVDKSSTTTGQPSRSQPNDIDTNVSESILNLTAKHGRIKEYKKVKVVFNNNGKIITIKNAQKRNKVALPAYEFEDGTIAIDVESLPKNDQLKFINNGLFDFTEDIDVLDTNSTWRIDQSFVLRKQANDLVVAENGLISKAESKPSSPVEESAASNNQSRVSSAAPNLGPTLSPAPNAQATESPAPSQRSSSTGQLDDNSNQGPTEQSQDSRDEQQPETKAERRPAPIVFSDIEIDTIEANVAHIFGEIIENPFAEGVDYASYATEVKARMMELKDAMRIPNLTEEAVDNAIVKQIEQFKQYQELNASILGDNNSGDDVNTTGAAMAMAARYEELTTSDMFSKLFTNAAERFLNEYEKVVVVPTADGKKLVSLEEILRICNNVYPIADTGLAKHMYELVKAYLNTESAKLLYKIIDEEKGDKIIEDLNKSLDEIQEEENPVEVSSFRVNIVPQIEQAKDSSVNRAAGAAFYAEMQKLHVGDNVQIVNSPEELVIMSNGVALGTMTKPKIVGSKYQLPVSGWIMDVELDGHCNPISDLKDTFDSLLTGTTSSHRDLRMMLTDYITRIKSLNDPAKKEQETDRLVQLFSQLDIIDDLVVRNRLLTSDRIIEIDNSGNADYHEMFMLLSRLWDYTYKTVRAGSFDENIKQIKANLNRWFKSVYNNYNAVSNVNSNMTTTITDISEGQVIKIASGHILDHYDELPLAKDAIADFENSRISVVDIADEYKMNVSGRPDLAIRKFGKGQTYITLFSRNERPDFVQAIGLKANTANIKNSDFPQIKRAVRDAIKDAIKHADTIKIEDIIELFSCIVSTKDKQGDRSPIFRPLGRGTFDITPINKPGTDGITIYYNNRRLQIYTKSYGGGNVGYKTNTMPAAVKADASGMANNAYIADTIADEFIKFLEQTCTINISALGIKSDNLDDTSYIGFINRQGGKLVVNIPTEDGTSYSKTFDSFNDFLIQGNLIKVNTKKGENGTNFDNRGNNQYANQNLYISLPIEKSKPARTVTTVPATNTKLAFISPTSVEETYTKVRSIIDSDKEHANTGVEIFKAILGEEEYNRFSSILAEYTILDTVLPESVTWYWGEEKGKHLAAIAYSNPKNTTPSFRVKNDKGDVLNSPDKFRKDVKVLIDSRWANMASNKYINFRKEAIRKLIHEQLHLRLGKNPEERTKVLAKIQSIYNIYDKQAAEDLKAYYALQDKVAVSYGNENSNIKEVEEYLNTTDNLTEEELKIKNGLNRIKIILNYREALLAYKGDVRLEEFLVESITSTDMYNYLNSITYEATDNKKKDSLFTALIKAIAKFFGWNEVKDNTLLMHELNVLRDVLDTGEPTEVETTKEEPAEEKPAEEEQKGEDKEKGNNDEGNNDKGDNNTSNEQKDEDKKEESFIDDFFNDSYNNPDDEARTAAIEESTPDAVIPDGSFLTKNIQAFRDRLPIELHNQFDALRNSGVIEITCH